MFPLSICPVCAVGSRSKICVKSISRVESRESVFKFRLYLCLSCAVVGKFKS